MHLDWPAEVRKPARSECPENARGSRPALMACSFTILATLRSVSRPPTVSPPLPIRRNTALAEISAAWSHARSAFTGHALLPRMMATVAPWPSWCALPQLADLYLAPVVEEARGPTDDRIDATYVRGRPSNYARSLTEAALRKAAPGTKQPRGVQPLRSAFRGKEDVASALIHGRW